MSPDIGAWQEKREMEARMTKVNRDPVLYMGARFVSHQSVGPRLDYRFFVCRRLFGTKGQRR
jgi:hypothetical protein